MLDTQDLQHLTRWCARRHLQWQPGRTERGDNAIMLQATAGRTAWSGMMLVVADDELALTDALGDILATASELPSLLDALDAGVAAPPLPTALPAPLAGLLAAAQPWRSSAAF